MTEQSTSNQGNGKREVSRSVQKSKIDEKLLEKLAVEEIMREIAIKSVKAKEFGPTRGFQNCPLGRTNKRFLGTTIASCVSHNSKKSQKEKISSEKMLEDLDYKKRPSRRPKFGERQFVFKKPERDCTKSLI